MNSRLREIADKIASFFKDVGYDVEILGNIEDGFSVIVSSGSTHSFFIDVCVKTDAKHDASGDDYVYALLLRRLLEYLFDGSIAIKDVRSNIGETHVRVRFNDDELTFVIEHGEFVVEVLGYFVRTEVFNR